MLYNVIYSKCHTPLFLSIFQQDSRTLIWVQLRSSKPSKSHRRQAQGKIRWRSEHGWCLWLALGLGDMFFVSPRVIEIRYIWNVCLTHNVKSGLINIPLLINLLLPPKKCNLKTGGPPRLINTVAYPRLINHQCWNLIFSSGIFYFQFFLSHQSQNSSLLYLRFKLIIENFKKQLFPKWSISN